MNVAAYPKYESYKATGVSWAPEVPKHWDVMSLKFLAQLKSGDTITAERFTNAGYPVYGGNGFRGFTDRKTHTGHLVLIGRQGALCGNVNYAQGEFFASEHAIVVTPNRPLETIWLGEAIRCASLNQLSQSAAQPGLSTEVIGNQRFPFPPLVEQRAISAFLDDKCAAIDEAVRIKAEQIALLRERRQILIQQAVTRGLTNLPGANLNAAGGPQGEGMDSPSSPDAPMQDSGIDWIGQIPAHWEVRRNFSLFRETKAAGNEELPVLSVSIHSGVSKEELSAEENIRSIIKIQDRSSYKEVLPGDIAYNMMRAWQGGIGAVHTHGMVSPAYVVARPVGVMVGEYFELLYRTPAFIHQMDANSKGITDFRKRLYWDDFRSLVTIVPPAVEQIRIVQYASHTTRSTDKAITLKQSQITALKEYKTVLINAAVTGKIKVA